MPQQKSAYPECRHILTTGRKCQGPALKGRPFCHHHAHRRNLAARNHRSINSIELPPLEDHSSVVLAIDQIVFALTHRRITDELAARLLYAIQLAQNSLNRIKEVAPEDMVTDYVHDPFGDIAAPEDSNAEPSANPANHDDFPPVAEHAKTHSSHGDTRWEPTNADYTTNADYPTNADITTTPVIPNECTAGERVEGPVLAFQDANPTREPSAHLPPSQLPRRQNQMPPVPRPGGTRDNSPGRQSRGQESDSIAEVPEGRPNLAPPKPGPQKSGAPKTGPWDNPLLDHIVHQLQSGMSEREVAAQLERDLHSGSQNLR